MNSKNISIPSHSSTDAAPPTPDVQYPVGQRSHFLDRPPALYLPVNKPAYSNFRVSMWSN